MKALEWLRELVKTGCDNEFSEEENRRAVVINLFAFTGTGLTIACSIPVLFQNDFPLAISLFVAAIIFVLTHLFMTLAKTTRMHVTAASLLVCNLMLLLLYLIYFGGSENTGPMWILILPPVTFFLMGLRLGMTMLVLYLVLISAILFAPDITQAHYPFAFKVRIALVYATVTFLSAVYEYSRQQTYAEIQALREKYEYQASYDPLTDLFNRRGMIKHIEPELARTKRQSSRAAIVLIDIDRFKQLNDKFGHHAGDTVLQATASLFKKGIRQQDYAARWGGEEFLLLLPDTSQENAFLVAEKLRLKLQNTPQLFKQFELSTTASFGISEVCVDRDFSRALTLADKALYSAKQSGRNKVVISTAE